MGKCGKGTGSFGLRHTKTHTLCRRCGRRSFHIQKVRSLQPSASAMLPLLPIGCLMALSNCGRRATCCAAPAQQPALMLALMLAVMQSTCGSCGYPAAKIRKCECRPCLDGWAHACDGRRDCCILQGRSQGQRQPRVGQPCGHPRGVRLVRLRHCSGAGSRQMVASAGWRILSVSWLGESSCPPPRGGHQAQQQRSWNGVGVACWTRWSERSAARRCVTSWPAGLFIPAAA